VAKGARGIKGTTANDGGRNEKKVKRVGPNARLRAGAKRSEILGHKGNK